MGKYDLLQDLLPLLQAYEMEESKGSVQDFLVWANQKQGFFQQNLLENSLKTNDKACDQAKPYHHIPPQGSQRAQITQLLALMYKYLKFYFKKVSLDTPLSSVDDFGMLATLWLEGDMRKNELIEKNTLEFTSGMEVIRRLERHELIEAFADPDDARARRVKITEKGQVLFIGIMPRMQQIGRIALGNLNEDEQTILYDLLFRLNDFHQPIFHQAKKEDLQNIVSEFLS